MKRPVVIALAIFVALAALAQAQASVPKHTHDKVDFEVAKGTAQHKVPKGILTSHDLVHEHGHLVYSFWFVEAGKSGSKEVDVDAESGKVVKVKHESVESAQKERVKDEKQQFRH